MLAVPRVDGAASRATQGDDQLLRWSVDGDDVLPKSPATQYRQLQQLSDIDAPGLGELGGLMPMPIVIAAL